MKFFLCLLLLQSSMLSADSREQRATVQQTLPLPFCYFENLYLDSSTSTFLAAGKNIHPAEAIAPMQKRGYQLNLADTGSFAKKPHLMEGTTLFLCEFPETGRYLNHFFHLIEHALGIWSFYGEKNRDDIMRIVLCSDGKTSVDDWEGPNGINRHLLLALFPKARVVTWSQLLAENKNNLLCFEKAVTSDRALTLSSPECNHLNKMLGAARHFLSPGSLENFSNRVHAYVKSSPRKESQKQITYLVRPYPRTLSDEVERNLLTAIEKIEGVSIKKYDFAKLSFQEQVNIIGNTDILIGVHGNGLSHILFLPPHASVVEIFPAGSQCFDYQLLAEARNLNYCKIIADQGVMGRKEGYDRGVFGMPDRIISKLDINPILSFIEPAHETKSSSKSSSRILIGSPIRQKPEILREFLESLERLEHKSYAADYFFIEGNEEGESKKLMREFASKHGSHCLVISEPESGLNVPYIRNENTHFWKEEIIWKIAGFKDLMIKKARDENYDYLFLVDSDLVLHPHTVEQLISDKKDIVTNNFWTKWGPDMPPLPQVWLLDHYTLFHHEIGEQVSKEEAMKRMTVFLDQLKKPGVYEVGGLGACTLISRHALQKGVSFARIKNLTFWGEDRHFCIRATALGLSLHTDTHYPAYHIYRESEIAGVEEFKVKSTSIQ